MVDLKSGRKELRSAMRRSRGLLALAAFFSVFVNLLMLTGPLFMLQVYDRVLASQSEETLIALVVLITALFALMALLDAARSQLVARVGARLHTLLARRADAIALEGRAPGAADAPRNLATVQSTLSGPAPFVLFDAPWTPLFVAALFVFHFWLGVLAVAGALLMLAIAAAQQWSGRRAQDDAARLSAGADALSQTLTRERDAVRALGMGGAVLDRLGAARRDALGARVGAGDGASGFASATKSLRFYLQSAMLAAGAALAINGDITPGAMIAASVLLGRALAPIEQGVAQWPAIASGRIAWRALAATLSAAPEAPTRTALPTPRARLTAQNVTVAAPGSGALCLIGVSFDLEPGEALAVVGPSGGGKSTLTRALIGLWPISAGSIRIDGATPAQWDPDALGAQLGYLPQEVGLLRGTIAENIARMATAPDAAALIAAAKRAGAHEMILRLPRGYDTMIDPTAPGGMALSGGQRQRIGLARALYGDPPILVLDEPSAHLDEEGEAALLAAVRDQKARGGGVIMTAHRAEALAVCDKILRLEKGRVASYGPRVSETGAPTIASIAARATTQRRERRLGAAALSNGKD